MKTLFYFMAVVISLCGTVTARAQGLPESPKPKWLDTETKIELSASLASIAGDGWTTAWDQSRHSYDVNPLIGRGPRSSAFLAGYFAGAAGAMVVGDYLMYRYLPASHWERRVIRVLTIGVESYWINNNIQTHRTFPR